MRPAEEYDRTCFLPSGISEPGASPDQMMKQAEGAGFPVTNPVSQQFIKDILGKS